MYKETTFVCEHCGKEFNSEQECRKHEESHTEDFTYSTNEEIAERLSHFAEWSSNYRIGNEVLGMPIESFDNLMGEAARRLRKDE